MLNKNILNAVMLLGVANCVSAQQVPTGALPFISQNGIPLVSQKSAMTDPILLPNDLNTPEAIPAGQADGIQPVISTLNSESEEPIALQQPRVEANYRPKKSENRPGLLDAKKTKEKAEHNPDLSLGAIVIKPRPGMTESAVIKRGKMNRIITPFDDVKVISMDPIETKIEGRDLYIVTESEVPVSLYIMSQSNEGSTLSLQLVPKDSIAPVEIKIADTGQHVSAEHNDNRYNKSSQPYVNEIKSIMQSMGKQLIPSGFTLSDLTPAIANTTFCHDPNLTFLPGQVLTGSSMKMVVLVAQNTNSTPVNFEESSCANGSVISVAAWPKIILNPGDRTEVYVLMQSGVDDSHEESRPRLVSQN
jgi:conjugal transfer pilus assembly protein TraK